MHRRHNSSRHGSNEERELVVGVENSHWSEENLQRPFTVLLSCDSSNPAGFTRWVFVCNSCFVRNPIGVSGPGSQETLRCVGIDFLRASCMMLGAPASRVGQAKGAETLPSGRGGFVSDDDPASRIYRRN